MKQTLQGLLRALLYGVVLSVGLTGLLLVGGLVASGGQMETGMQVARSGLLMIGALGILLMAGLILFKRKVEERFDFLREDSWRERFGRLSLGTVLGLVCLLLLFTGMLVDYFIFVNSLR